MKELQEMKEMFKDFQERTDGALNANDTHQQS